MTKYLALLLIIFLFQNCHNSEKKTEPKKHELLESKARVEWFVPAEDADQHFDTIVKFESDSLSINIRYSPIPNNTFDLTTDTGDTLMVEKARNYQAELTINKKNRMIFSQVYTKNDFKKFIDTESLNPYILTGFEFNGTREDKLFFSSSICLYNSDDLINVEIKIDSRGNAEMNQGEIPEY